MKSAASLDPTGIECLQDRLNLLRDEVLSEGGGQSEGWQKALLDLSSTLKSLRESYEEIGRLKERIAAVEGSLEEERRDRLELMDAIPVGFVLTDGAGVIREVNRRARNFLGSSRGSLLGKTLTSLIGDECRSVLAEPLERLRTGREKEFHVSDLPMKPNPGIPADVSLHVSAFCESGPERLFWWFRDDTERKRAEAEAAQARADLERSRAEMSVLTVRLWTAQEEERRRLSRELHDETSQKLASLSMELEVLAKDLTGSSGMTAGRLRSLCRSVGELSEEIRNMAHQLHPSILEDLGLSAALKSLIEEIETREGIEVEYVPGKVPRLLPRDVASCFYRVAQESLRNAARHAHAKLIRVILWRTARSLSLVVEDTGTGFDPARARSSTRGLGIISMEERVRLVNGRFSLQSRPGIGTRVSVRVPLPRIRE